MSYAMLAETHPVARKRHRCIWCADLIEAGTKYTHEKSVYDGQMQDHKWHNECLAGFRAELRDGGDEEFLPYSNERYEAVVATTLES